MRFLRSQAPGTRDIPSQSMAESGTENQAILSMKRFVLDPIIHRNPFQNLQPVRIIPICSACPGAVLNKPGSKSLGGMIALPPRKCQSGQPPSSIQMGRGSLRKGSAYMTPACSPISLKRWSRNFSVEHGSLTWLLCERTACTLSSITLDMSCQ